jgi:hypothetical protein
MEMYNYFCVVDKDGLVIGTENDSIVDNMERAPVFGAHLDRHHRFDLFTESGVPLFKVEDGKVVSRDVVEMGQAETAERKRKADGLVLNELAGLDTVFLNPRVIEDLIAGNPVKKSVTDAIARKIELRGRLGKGGS